MKHRLVPLVVAAIGLSRSSLALAAGVRFDDFVVSTPMSHAQRDATVRAARAFYDVWNIASFSRALSPPTS